jgi:signal transduction histidine kinase
MKLHRFKSRQRVTIRLAIGLVLVMCIGSWLTREWVKRELRNDIDHRLRTQATEMAAGLESVQVGMLRQLSNVFDSGDLGVAQEDWGIVLRSPDGETASFGVGSKDPDALPAVVDVPITELRGRAGEPFTVDSAGGDDDAYRVVSIPLSGGRVAVIASSLDNVNAVTRILHKTFFVGTLLGVLALGFLVWMVSRHVLKPLEDMVDTAHNIGAGNLDTRVNVESTAPDVERLSDAMNAMLARLQTAFDQQDRTEARLRQFVSNASHELRTPLAAILGHAELYHERMARSPEDVDRAMRHITAEGTRMQSLVEDLLLLARLDEGRQLARDAVDLTAVVDEAVAAVATLDGDHSVIVDAEPVEVIGDQLALRQIIDNLLINVVVHTPPGTTATVGLAPVRVAGRTDGDGDGGACQVRLVISDDGPGMPPEIAAHVFERFVRAERSRARPDGSLAGSGLGLSIVDELVRAHGGTITLDTSPGAGATFTITLPSPQNGQDVPTRSGKDSLRQEPSDPAANSVRVPST